MLLGLVAEREAGSFSGPFVSGEQSLLVLASYLVVLALSGGSSGVATSPGRR